MAAAWVPATLAKPVSPWGECCETFVFIFSFCFEVLSAFWRWSGLGMHRGGWGCPGASGHVSSNATVQLETTEEWLFPSLGDGVWVWTECLPATEESSRWPMGMSPGEVPGAVESYVVGSAVWMGHIYCLN